MLMNETRTLAEFVARLRGDTRRVPPGSGGYRYGPRRHAGDGIPGRGQRDHDQLAILCDKVQTLKMFASIHVLRM